jgi:molybdate transport system substrate-binding protein
MRRLLLHAVAAVATAILASASQAAEGPTVFAAASMKEALEATAEAFEAEGGAAPVFSFAASSVLARQIEAGAPADIFISGDEEWMDWLSERGLIAPETRRIVARNSLVVAGAEGAAPVEDPGEVLAAGRFAMGDPAHVPAGRYAQAALERLEIWEEVRPHAVFGENVRVALELVRRAEVGAAIVYASDLRAAPELAVLFTFPADAHPPIVYPAAAVAGGDAEAVAFLDFLSGATGQRILAGHGFRPGAP